MWTLYNLQWFYEHMKRKALQNIKKWLCGDLCQEARIFISAKDDAEVYHEGFPCAWRTGIYIHDFSFIISFSLPLSLSISLSLSLSLYRFLALSPSLPLVLSPTRSPALSPSRSFALLLSHSLSLFLSLSFLFLLLSEILDLLDISAFYSVSVMSIRRSEWLARDVLSRNGRASLFRLFCVCANVSVHLYIAKAVAG